MQTTVPSVDAIMEEIRQGLEDTFISEATSLAVASGSSLQTELRKAAATNSLLGRCGGSMRGRLCQLLARPAKPVVEQINLFHAAVCGALGKLAESYRAQVVTEQKVAELEKRLHALEAQYTTILPGDAR